MDEYNETEKAFRDLLVQIMVQGMAVSIEDTIYANFQKMWDAAYKSGQESFHKKGLNEDEIVLINKMVIKTYDKCYRKARGEFIAKLKEDHKRALRGEEDNNISDEKDEETSSDS